MTLVPAAALLLIPFYVVSGESLDTMLVLETSPGTEQTIGLIRPKAFADSDRVGVVAFSQVSQVIQPLTDDREELARSLRRAGVRVGVSLGGGPPIYSTSIVDLAGALKKACGEFAEDSSEGQKRAIIVFFASEDAGLGREIDSLTSLLRTARIRLYSVVVPRVDSNQPPSVPRVGSTAVMTAQFMSRLAKESGGRIYRTHWDLKEILTEARKP